MIQLDAVLKMESTPSVNAIVTTTKSSAMSAEEKKTPGDVRNLNES
ncbi:MULTISPECIES: hypothetical protein [Rhodococcus]|uniref:Uncharacterized protein n=1 Tax=Rhodococcus sp. D-6 TaxID=1387842 RepID=A0AAU7V412_9NOCA|nr:MULTISPECIES: hypothetical protein [Rhodococcus]MCD2115860.1 hypothetical protein [Rhodococcus pyridinivorans]MCD2141895.1 hypothetical protein [Rhodococcus pyridinivorans]MCD5420157.1 hypothetical protein [Rhodococcus pyridinivorans]MCT7290465.1 hypothetical protein [Rhodococcus sp. PAE-6]MCW3470555.1 hypothetical protein [Rhodococcus pyridinivorans]